MQRALKIRTEKNQATYISAEFLVTKRSPEILTPSIFHIFDQYILFTRVYCIQVFVTQMIVLEEVILNMEYSLLRSGQA